MTGESTPGPESRTPASPNYDGPIHHAPIRVRVRAITLLSPTLKRLSLERVDGAPLPPAAPGAHVVLKLEGPSRIWRNAYSLTSQTSRRGDYEIVVRRTGGVRGGSQHVHEALREGDELELSAPANLFPLARTARKHLLIGGGVGLTPLLSFLPALLDAGAEFELHQVSAPGEIETFQALLASAGAAATVHVGRAGLDLQASMARQPLGTHVYVCGPEALMEAVSASAVQAGWPSANVHRESFGGAESGEPFTAVLARSGLRIEVGPHESLLEAIEGAGVDAPSLCRGGACGQCAVKVLEGEPEHRDHVLSPEAHAATDLMMTCVSRARTPVLVLDL